MAEPLATAVSDILRLGNPTHERIDAAPTRQQKADSAGTRKIVDSALNVSN